MRAIYLDVSVNTHSIYNEIKNNYESESIFDEITYYKGCSIIL